MSTLELVTTIVAFGPAAAIVLSDEQVSTLGRGKTPPVVVTIGEHSARLRVARMGGENCIGLSRESRAALDVTAGDRVTVRIALDVAERSVDLPADLAALLDSNPQSRAAFDAWSYTRRKEAVVSLSSAKQQATRARRLAKLMAELG